MIQRKGHPRLIISAPRGSGGALNHLRQIVPRLFDLRPEWRVELWSSRKVLHHLFGKTDASWMHEIPEGGYGARAAWEFVTLPRLLRDDGNAMVFAPFGPMFNLALAPRTVWMARHIVPLLDFDDWELSEGDMARVLVLRYMFAMSARAGKRAICVSEHARARLARLAHLPVQQIAFVRHGAEVGTSDRECVSSEAERVRNSPFFLHVGQPVPHRRVKELVEAYAMVAAEADDVPHLVLVGATRGVDATYAESYRTFAAPLVAQGRIVFLDQLCHDDVLTLTREATAIVYPSVHEDCPNALLEGLAAGRPVVCADTAASRELVEEAALLIPNPTAASLRDAIYALLHPNMRASLASRAKDRGQGFSWDECALRTVEILEAAFDAPER